MREKIIASIILIVQFIPLLSFAQGEAAVPFLMIPASPAGNGMAGIAGTIPTDDPTALLANPAQLGTSSLDNLLRAGFYPSSTAWLPGIGANDLTYNASAFSAGVNLNRFLQMPFGLSVGFAYSHVDINYGSFVITGSDPTPLGTFDAEEHANGLTFGVGFDYYIKVGFGYTHKNIESDLAPFDVQRQGKEGVANVSAEDAGVIAEIPVVPILDRLTGFRPVIWNTIEPSLDFTAGYSRRNCGDDKVIYIDAAQADPLPRSAICGVSYSIGFSHRGTSDVLRVLNFTGAHEAEDLLVMRFPAPVDSFGNPIGEPPPWQYARGAGAIQFVNNVIFGEGSTHATLRKGWQIDFCELFALRGGSVLGQGVSYTTSGYGIRFTGIMKLLERAAPSLSEMSGFAFILNHFDARFDHATTNYNDLTDFNNGVTYSGLSFIVK